jgi:release factor glutamine methyltransferase
MTGLLLKKTGKQRTDTECIGDLLNKGKTLLRKYGSERAEQESILLLSYLLKRKKSELFLNREVPVSSKKIRQYYQWLRKRREGYPVQYITGFQNFMGLEFAVSERVLIPRPETELLVENVIHLIEMLSGRKEIYLMDIGVGSGVIPITICHYFKNKNRYIDFHAVDLSSDALALASKNARRFHCQNNIQFYQGNLFQPFRRKEQFNTFDGIISNPPYISKMEWDNLPDEIRLFEPPLALLGGEKGIDFYKTIIKEAPQFLKPGGFLALEIGHQQKNIVCQFIKDNTNFQKEIKTFRDYYQNDRGIIAFKRANY